MNKAITEGINFTPAPFRDGLENWSSGDGTPGSASYATASNATLIAADADFSTCFEVMQTEAVQKIRYKGEIPIIVGCYIRVSVRVKAMSGPLPAVRIAAWAGGAGGTHISGVTETGPVTQLTTYGQVETITAIVGSGVRGGVDMVWGRLAVYGHFGLDLLGPTGGVVRVEDVEIEDITSVYLRDMMDVVDVRDYGAKGDGVTDDRGAFEEADAAANGRTILVPDGVYYLGESVSLNHEVRFGGRLVMPDHAVLALLKNFTYATYVDAFQDEQIAFKKAFQALMNYNGHDTLDLNGRQINLDGPIDLHAAVGNRDSFAIRRVIINGQIAAKSSGDWGEDVVSASANYSASDPNVLTNVANIDQIKQGSLIEGHGVGREVYVQSIDIAAKRITLSRRLYGANASQSYTFRRFKYLLDFNGFTNIKKMVFDNVEFQGAGVASGVILPPDGLIFHFRDCFFTSPKDRGITSPGGACSGMMIDRCQFLSDEIALDVPQRHSIGFNINANDAKIRDNRAVRFKHFGVVSGTGHIIAGNHFFQGDGVSQGERTAGIIFTTLNCKSTLADNYIDHCFIEWNNEHDEAPTNTGGFSFGGLAITGNIFMGADLPAWFRWIVVKPYGADHFLNGVTITNNVFKHINGKIDRVEMVDTSLATLNNARAANVIFSGNTFNNINDVAENPAVVNVTATTSSDTWTRDCSVVLPFGLPAKYVTSMVADRAIRNASNAIRYDMPYVQTREGLKEQSFKIRWPEPMSGTMICTVRGDTPN